MNNKIEIIKSKFIKFAYDKDKNKIKELKDEFFSAFSDIFWYYIIVFFDKYSNKELKQFIY